MFVTWAVSSETTAKRSSADGRYIMTGWVTSRDFGGTRSRRESMFNERSAGLLDAERCCQHGIRSVARAMQWLPMLLCIMK